MSEPRDEDPPGGEAPKPRYEGPFKSAAARKAEGEAAKKTTWLSPWRIYGLGMLAGLTLAGFYAMKLTVTPDMVRKSAEADAPPPTPARPSIAAYCLSLRGAGAAAPVEPSPFCTEARPASCHDGDALQLTYATNGARPRFVYAATVTPDLGHAVVAEAMEVRAGAAGDTPLGQGTVKAARARSPLAVVALFSREPLREADVAPWFDRWKTGVRLLSRPPELPPSLVQKGAELVAFTACVGK